jgi:hypothetical protein
VRDWSAEPLRGQERYPLRPSRQRAEELFRKKYNIFDYYVYHIIAKIQGIVCTRAGWPCAAVRTHRFPVSCNTPPGRRALRCLALQHRVEIASHLVSVVVQDSYQPPSRDRSPRGTWSRRQHPPAGPRGDGCASDAAKSTSPQAATSVTADAGASVLHPVRE